MEYITKFLGHTLSISKTNIFKKEIIDFAVDAINIVNDNSKKFLIIK